MAPKTDTQEVAIARVYARALLDLAEERQLADQVLEELQGLVAVADETVGLGEFLATPLVDAEERAAALERMLRGRLDDLLVNTLQVMNRKGRLGLLPALAVAYRQEYLKLKGIVEVDVVSAVPVSEALRGRIADGAARLTGKEARLVETVDPAILGGLVIRVGDKRFDSSVAAEIRKLGARLLERASREVQTTGSARVIAEAES